jgi:hypothetical protein
MKDSRKKRTDLFNRNGFAHYRRSDEIYLGPHRLLMKFRNFNPLKDPKIEASQYEDAFQDVGREEMERRFSERRKLFLTIYDRRNPTASLPRYEKAAQVKEGYRYKPAARCGPVSLFLAGSVPAKPLCHGELPECQLLGFVDGGGRVGCMAHPLAETSQGYDGRTLVGFFNHTHGCASIGCEASKEFGYLSPSALKIFDRTVAGLSWYEYSRHATSVLVYYLRGYDHLLQMLDDRKLLDRQSLDQLVGFTNRLFDTWPLKHADRKAPESLVKTKAPLSTHPNHFSERMSSMEILSRDIPLRERILYLALDTWYRKDLFSAQLQQARDHLEKCMEKFPLNP